MKTSSLFLVPALLLFFVTPVLAKEGKFNELRQEVKDKRAEVRTEIKEKREDIKEVRQEVRNTKAQATVKRLRQGITSRYENTLKHKSAIETRIAKIEAIVVPTPKAKRDLTAAKAELAKFSDAKYKSDLALFDAKSAEVLASTTPLKLTPELKTLAKTLDADIKAMRTTLADTLRLIIKAR
ncbi:MAG: hypothetical protein WC069_05415 [Candidatus Shapirobacteria bacterium]